VSREHRRAKTDRLDTQQLMRAFLGRLCGERQHCEMRPPRPLPMKMPSAPKLQGCLDAVDDRGMLANEGLAFAVLCVAECL
jgi:hypothetical protein